MKRLFKFFAALALGALALGACGKEEPEETDPVNLLDLLYPNGQEVRGRTIQSTAMKQTMKYNVWLPPGFDEKKAYPFLYLLHGAGDNQDAWQCSKAQAWCQNFFSEAFTALEKTAVAREIAME